MGSKRSQPRRGYRSRKGAKRYKKVVAGYVGRKKFRLKKDSFLERVEKLFKTMGDSGLKAPVRACAKETLSKLISSYGGQLRDDRKQLLAGRTEAELGELELAKLRSIDAKRAKLNSVKDRFEKAKARLTKF